MTTRRDPEENDPIACPHCGKTLDRIFMQRETSLERGERIRLLVAGLMNATALRALAKLLKGWADQ